MIKPRLIWSKVRHDQVLNLSELAHASGYDRAVLSRMNLPLQDGKISLADFKRILRKRQDYREKLAKKAVNCRASVSDAAQVKPPDAIVPFGSVNGSQRQATADKFYAQSSKRAGKSASHPAQSTPLRNTA